MNHFDFITQLQRIAPTTQDYLDLGVTTDFAVRNEKNYIVHNKSIIMSSQLEFQKFELLSLIKNFDCANLQIGLISFFEEPLSESLHLLIGKVELDILAINKSTLEIEVLDHDMLDHLIWSCASNGEAFLDALFEFASYLIYKLKHKVYIDHAGEVECAQKCAERAGGEKYIDFYQMLIQS